MWSDFHDPGSILVAPAHRREFEGSETDSTFYFRCCFGCFSSIRGVFSSPTFPLGHGRVSRDFHLGENVFGIIQWPARSDRERCTSPSCFVLPRWGGTERIAGPEASTIHLISIHMFKQFAIQLEILCNDMRRIRWHFVQRSDFFGFPLSARRRNFDIQTERTLKSSWVTSKDLEESLTNQDLPLISLRVASPIYRGILVSFAKNSSMQSHSQRIARLSKSSFDRTFLPRLYYRHVFTSCCPDRESSGSRARNHACPPRLADFSRWEIVRAKFKLRMWSVLRMYIKVRIPE